MLTERICGYQPFDNGASPSWSRGNSPVVRVGDRLFVTNSRVDPERKPLDNTYLELWEKRGDEAWRMVWADDCVYQREPCPILYLGDHRLAVTVNIPAQPCDQDHAAMDEPCIPTLYVFDISGEAALVKRQPLPWSLEEHEFIEHSYRGCARDDQNGSIFLDNLEYSIGYRFCYALLNPDLSCRKTGYLQFPERCCYHTIAMRGGETYLFAVQDIKESVAEWKEYKFQMTGNTWDYDFRKIYLNYSPDIANGDFMPSQLICDESSTCGWITHFDCCFDPNGDMLFLVGSQHIKPLFMRDKFFPDQPLESKLEIYRFSHGVLIDKTLVDHSVETTHDTQYSGFFHTAKNGEVYLVWSKETINAENPMPTGTYLSKVSALGHPPLRLLDTYGFFFGNKVRLGAQPSDTLDLYWTRGDQDIMYGRHIIEGT